MKKRYEQKMKSMSFMRLICEFFVNFLLGAARVATVSCDTEARRWINYEQFVNFM